MNVEESRKLDEVAEQVADVREQVQEVREQVNERFTGILVVLARMETKLDAVVSAKDDHEVRIRALEARPVGNPAVEAASQDHETRVRALEKFRWVLVGGGAAGGGAIGAAVAKIFGLG